VHAKSPSAPRKRRKTVTVTTDKPLSR